MSTVVKAMSAIHEHKKVGVIKILKFFSLICDNLMGHQNQTKNLAQKFYKKLKKTEIFVKNQQICAFFFKFLHFFPQICKKIIQKFLPAVPAKF